MLWLSAAQPILRILVSQSLSICAGMHAPPAVSSRAHPTNSMISRVGHHEHSLRTACLDRWLFSVHRVQGCCTVRTSSFDLSDLDAATGPSIPSCIGPRSPSTKPGTAAQPAPDGPARQSSGADRSSKRSNSLRATEHASGGAVPTRPEARASMELTEQHQSRDALLPAHQSGSTDAVLVPGVCPGALLHSNLLQHRLWAHA